MAVGVINLTLSTDWVVEYINWSLILLVELHIILGHQTTFGDRKKLVFAMILINFEGDNSTVSVRTKIKQPATGVQIQLVKRNPILYRNKNLVIKLKFENEISLF